MTKNLKNQFGSNQDIENFLESIIALMPGHVYWKDSSGVILGCNDLQAKSAGFSSRHEMVGKTDYDMPWKDQADILRKIDQEVIKTGLSQTLEEPSTLADGKNAIFLTKKVPLYKKGEIVGVLGISFDITEQKLSEQALKEQTEKAEQAHLARTEFLSTAAHEINNPLGGVIYILEHLKYLIDNLQDNFYTNIFKALDKSNSSDIIDNVNKDLNGLLDTYHEIKNGTDRAHQALTNLIQLHQLQINGVDTHLELNNVYEIVKEAKQIAKQQALNNIDVKIDFDSNFEHELIVDSNNLKEILVTVINNAIRFSKQNQRVKVIIRTETSSFQNYLMFSIQDFGDGISEAQLKDLNNLRMDKNLSRESRYRKPSIRLAMVKMRVDALKGKLWIESGLNQGTIVHIKIPYGLPNLAKQEFFHNQTDVLLKPLDTNNIKILLIEDDITIQKIVSANLKNLGYQVDVASTAYQALEKALANTYHVILVDISLPDALGIDVVRILQNKKPDEAIYVAFTSHASEEDEVYFLEQGFMTVLKKPVTKEELDHCIRKVMQAKVLGDIDED